jgi:hypothetical protein
MVRLTRKRNNKQTESRIMPESFGKKVLLLIVKITAQGSTSIDLESLATTEGGI